MFDEREFIMKVIKGMVGNYPDFQVGEYALDWYKNKKLTKDDLAEINEKIDEQYVTEEVTENEEDLH